MKLYIIIASKHARKYEARPPQVKNTKKKFRLDSNDFGFICAGVSNVGGYEGNAWCYEPTAILAPTKKKTKKLSVSWHYSEPCGVISECSGWRKAVVNLCLEFASDQALRPSTGTAEHSSIHQADRPTVHVVSEWQEEDSAGPHYRPMLHRSVVHSWNDHSLAKARYTWRGFKTIKGERERERDRDR